MKKRWNNERLKQKKLLLFLSIPIVLIIFLVFFFYHSVIQPKHQKEEKTAPSIEQRESMDSSNESKATKPEKETTPKLSERTIDDWLSQNEYQVSLPPITPNSSLTEKELMEIAQAERERATTNVPPTVSNATASIPMPVDVTNTIQRANEGEFVNHETDGSGHNQEETNEHGIPVNPTTFPLPVPEPTPKPNPEQPVPELTPDPTPKPEQPPVIRESTPVIVLKTNRAVVNENEEWTIYDYFEVVDELASSINIRVSTTMLKPVSNDIIITATNNFGRSATATLTMYLNTPPTIIVEKEDIQISIHEPIDLRTFVQAIDSSGKDISQKICVSGLVDFHKEGEYVVTYSAEDEFHARMEKEMTIQIVNEAPIIMGEDIQIQLNESIDPLKFVHVVDTEDDRDGHPITLQETNIIENTINSSEVGEYQIIYGNVTDRDGKEAEQKVLKVTVVDTIDSEESVLERSENF